MLTFQELIQSEYESAYDYAYDLTMKKTYSEPKIYMGNNDLSKRWYVYFSYEDPNTGKLKRQTPIYGNANTFKTKEERLAVLSIYRRVLVKLLKQGYSPYEDNTELHTKLNTPTQLDTNNVGSVVSSQNSKTVQNNVVDKVVATPVNTVVKAENDHPTLKVNNHQNVNENQHKEIQQNIIPSDNQTEDKVNILEKNEVTQQIQNKKNKTTIEEAIELDLTLKEKSLRATSFRGYSSNLRRFKKWLDQKQKHLKYIEDVDKAVVVMYLNEVLLSSSARNRNNYKASISSFYTTLVDNDILPINNIKNIKKLKTQSVRHKTYTEEQQNEIFEYLEKEDQTLLLFIKFLSYSFLRPIEVCRLKIGDINLKEKTISYRAKNKNYKTRIIPSILYDVLPDLSKYRADDHLFNKQQIGGVWDLGDDSKRGYYTTRFKTVVKDKFKLGAEYGLYSFRHTFITKVYRSLAEQYSPYETKSRLMQITGHESMAALQAYLREIDVELPEDYSNYF